MLLSNAKLYNFTCQTYQCNYFVPINTTRISVLFAHRASKPEMLIVAIERKWFIEIHWFYCIDRIYVVCSIEELTDELKFRYICHVP